jgi:hypothetical protein
VSAHSCHAVLECIVTTDEVWVYHNTPETKSASIGWERPRSTRSKILPVETFAGKSMATVNSDHKGVLVVDFV